MITTTEETTLTAAPATAKAPRVSTQLISLDAIARNPAQPRRVFDEVKLQELADSLRAVGQLQPIVVLRQIVPLPDPDRPGVACQFLLVMGERRWRAARLNAANFAGAPREIEARVYEGVDEALAFEMALRENRDREDLNPIEEAQALRDAKERFGFTQKRLESVAGRSRSRLSNILRLLDLPVPVQEFIGARKLLAGHGEALLRWAAWPAVCLAIAERAVITKATQAQLEQPLPFAAELSAAGVIAYVEEDALYEVGLDYDDAGVFQLLKALPFIHVIKAPTAHADDELIALDPAKWAQWLRGRAEMKAERDRERVRELNAEIAGTAPAAAEARPAKLQKATEPVDLGRLDYGSYRVLDDLPAEVRAKIPADKIEIGRRWRGEEPVKFTREVKFVDGLQRAAAMKKNKAAREQLDAALDLATANVRAIRSVREADLAHLGAWVQVPEAQLREAFSELGLELSAKRPDLGKLSGVDIVRAVLLGKLRAIWHDARRNAGAVPSDLAGYAGDYKAEAKRKRDGAKGQGAGGKAAAVAAVAEGDLTPAMREQILAWDVATDGPLSECAKRFCVSLSRVANLRMNASRKGSKGKAKKK